MKSPSPARPGNIANSRPAELAPISHPPSTRPLATGSTVTPASKTTATILDSTELDQMVEDGKKSPILIVDDEPFVADLIHHWVHTVWDYPAIIAHSGEEAIIMMREQHPRMVLLDIQLPDINGIDVLRAMKSADEYLPIVMVSAQE